MSLQKALSLFTQKKSQILHDFFTLLRFKSISADPSYRKDLEACCLWLEHYLKKCHLKVERWEKPGGNSVIFAQSEAFDPTKETLLLYGHYDVQPVDPIELWTSDPFEPQERHGEIFARGASDNKGQLFYTMCAIKMFLELNDSIKFNIKYLIEGEEESGSAVLSTLLEEKKERFKADHILIVDSGIPAKDQPAITLGARGIITMTLTLKEAHFDLHSGSYGGLVYNPNRALAELLAKTHDKENRVTIPNFYDDVRPITSSEKTLYNLSFNAALFKEKFGAEPTGVEKGYDPGEAISLRPTLEINGIAGGYSGLGFKTVIPSVASAKISCRLVPDQKPEKIASLVKDYFQTHLPQGISINIEIHEGMGEGLRTRADSKIAHIATIAYEDVFQKKCHKIVLGGSVPISAQLQKISGGDLIFIGVDLPDDRIHSPNEHFGIDRLEKGFLTILKILDLLNV